MLSNEDNELGFELGGHPQTPAEDPPEAGRSNEELARHAE